MTKETEAIGEITKALGLSSVAPQVYSDLLAPLARELGADLLLVAKAVSIALAPLQAAVWGYERVRERLALSVMRKLAKTAPELISPPPLNVAGPVLFRLQFVQEEEALREMYATLLASAMVSTTASRVHPAFGHVIEQLTGNEAKVLRQVVAEHLTSIGIETTSDGGVPINQSDWIQGHFERLCERAGLPQPKLFPAYLDNLLRLRLLEVGEWADIEYEPEGDNRYGTYGPSVQQQRSRELSVTEFGRRFLEVCVVDE